MQEATGTLLSSSRSGSSRGHPLFMKGGSAAQHEREELITSQDPSSAVSANAGAHSSNPSGCVIQRRPLQSRRLFLLAETTAKGISVSNPLHGLCSDICWHYLAHVNPSPLLPSHRALSCSSRVLAGESDSKNSPVSRSRRVPNTVEAHGQ